MKLISLLRKSALKITLSLSMILSPTPTKAMEPMQWSKTPEMTLKTGDRAKFNGVLIPDLNYRNYKSLEAINPIVMQGLEEYPQNCSHDFDISPLIWFVGGALIGGLAVARVK